MRTFECVRRALSTSPGATTFVASLAVAAIHGCTGNIGPAGSGALGSGATTSGGAGPGGGDNGAPRPPAPGAPAGVTLTNDDGPAKFSCDASKPPPMNALRALSTAQVQASIRDLIAWALQDAKGGDAVISEVTDAMASLPGNVPIVPTNSDRLPATFPDGGWLRADQDVQLSRVQAFYKIGSAIGDALVKPTRIGAVVGGCATDSDTTNDAACLTSFIQRFGARALRRPLTPDDVSFYQGVYGANPTADPAAYADVVTALLNAPEFLYFVEHGDQPVSGSQATYTLGAYELAARLSYHVWDTAPDDELLAAAADGSLLQDPTYKKEVDRLFADPRAKTSMHRFFEDYIQVNSTGGPRGTGGLNYHDLALRDADPEFKAFAGSDLPSPSLERDMVDDALGFLDYYTWTQPGTIHDLLTSDLSFAKTANVAKIYGVPTWTEGTSPPSFPAGQRPGLFTRAIFVAGGADTAPILKGVYLRRYLLCDTIGRPPPQAAKAMVAISATQTTRQVTEALTAVSPCNGCHTNWLNPLGFVTENFDGLGRLRTQQTLFRTDGTVSAMLPVDTAVVPYVNMADDTTKASNAGDVMREIDASLKPAACLTRNYFRYTFARFEDLSADGCSLEQVRSTLDGSGHLVDMLKAVVETPAFKQRTFQ